MHQAWMGLMQVAAGGERPELLDTSRPPKIERLAYLSGWWWDYPCFLNPPAACPLVVSVRDTGRRTRLRRSKAS